MHGKDAACTYKATDKCHQTLHFPSAMCSDLGAYSSLFWFSGLHLQYGCSHQLYIQQQAVFSSHKLLYTLPVHHHGTERSSW